MLTNVKQTLNANPGRAEKVCFRSKTPGRFKVPSNQPSLGDRLLHKGELTSDPVKVQECWTNHFQSILQSKVGTSTCQEACQEDLTHLALLSKMNFDDIVDQDFTVEEIEASLRKLKCGRAGGFDDLQPEHLKYSGPLLTLWLKQTFCAFVHLNTSHQAS